MKKPLVACPECACHVEPHESLCVHCGASLGRPAESRQTSSAIALGLAVTLAGPIQACGDDTSSSSNGGSGGGGGGGTGAYTSEGGMGGQHIGIVYGGGPSLDAQVDEERAGGDGGAEDEGGDPEPRD